MAGWGQSKGGSSSAQETSTLLRDRGVFPCLDVLYPGRFRAHCAKCIADCAVSQFTRKNAVFVVVYHEKRGCEVLVRILYDAAETLVKNLALGKIKFGDPIRIQGGKVVRGEGDGMSGDDVHVQDTDVSRGAIAKAFVDNKFVLLDESVGDVYLLDSARPAPYLLLYHSEATPSKHDIAAYEQNYSEAYIRSLDEQYEEALYAKR